MVGFSSCPSIGLPSDHPHVSRSCVQRSPITATPAPPFTHDTIVSCPHKSAAPLRSQFSTQLFGALAGSSGRSFVCLAPDLRLSALRLQSLDKGGDLVAPALRRVALFSRLHRDADDLAFASQMSEVCRAWSSRLRVMNCWASSADDWTTHI